MKSFSLVREADIFSYEVGISRGWEGPSFVDKNEDLTEYEESILSGIQQMKDDKELPKKQRGG